MADVIAVRRTMQMRRVRSGVSVFLTALCAGSAAAALLLILGYVVHAGIASIGLPFLTQVPHPVGIPGGGVANAIVGTGITVAISVVMATPLGVLTGVYLAIYGRGAAASSIRFLSDVLAGVPSIAIGLFAYVVLVAPFKHFSAISGAFAFAVLMLPVIIRTTEEAIRSVPIAIREGALALGLPIYATTLRVVIPAARAAIITGLLLSIARVTGETAPLLFTAFGSQFWEFNPANPMAQLPLQIFNYAISPYPEWHQQAWGGALILIVVVLFLNILARAALRSRASR
ncbi:phosphate ABC transporter permease PstA [bacterium]|nr:MAG: phosphate ABC transporter permease PstA [bacterium]